MRFLGWGRWGGWALTDQLKKTQLDVINIETLCTNFPHNKDQYALQSYAVASVERMIAKNWALRMSLGLS